MDIDTKASETHKSLTKKVTTQKYSSKEKDSLDISLEIATGNSQGNDVVAMDEDLPKESALNKETNVEMRNDDMDVDIMSMPKNEDIKFSESESGGAKKVDSPVELTNQEIFVDALSSPALRSCSPESDAKESGTELLSRAQLRESKNESIESSVSCQMPVEKSLPSDSEPPPILSNVEKISPLHGQTMEKSIPISSDGEANSLTRAQSEKNDIPLITSTPSLSRHSDKTPSKPKEPIEPKSIFETPFPPAELSSTLAKTPLDFSSPISETSLFKTPSVSVNTTKALSDLVTPSTTIDSNLKKVELTSLSPEDTPIPPTSITRTSSSRKRVIEDDDDDDDDDWMNQDPLSKVNPCAK
jgi:hypothetical protein